MWVGRLLRDLIWPLGHEHAISWPSVGSLDLRVRCGEGCRLRDHGVGARQVPIPFRLDPVGGGMIRGSAAIRLSRALLVPLSLLLVLSVLNLVAIYNGWYY